MVYDLNVLLCFGVCCKKLKWLYIIDLIIECSKFKKWNGRICKLIKWFFFEEEVDKMKKWIKL